ncbi:MAG: pyridoxal phosphate-dependent decarboxylase family protein [Thermocrispum sp.]
MTSYPLEPEPFGMLRMGMDAVTFVSETLWRLSDTPASRFADDPAAFRLTPVEEGHEFTDALRLFADAASDGIETAGPRYFGYIPSGGLYASAVADLLSCGLNRSTGLSGFSPALVAMEDGVIRWLCGQFGLSPTAGGVMTSGGSMAHLTAIVAARAERLGEDFAGGTLYTTAQAHYSVAKAARIAGFPASSIRIVPTTRALRMDRAAAARMIAADRRAGLRPFLLVANAGTTSTGTVDKLGPLARLAAAEDLWFHVDAAYGGFFQLTERGRTRLRGIELADSLVVDPHKSLFAPYGTGMLLVRDTAPLQAAHSATGEYLRDLHPTALPHYANYGPELTRDFRGLRLWLPLWVHGVAAFRSALDEKLDLARSAYRTLRRHRDFETPLPPDLSTVVFRAAGLDDVQNRRVLEAVNATGRAFLSGTVVNGRYVMRLCVLSHRSHACHVREALSVLTDVRRDLLGEHALACTTSVPGC